MPTIATITGIAAPTRPTTTRIQFVQQRNEALSRQRGQVLDRLAKLRAEVAKISASIESGTLTNPERTLAVLERYATKERALVADADRLAKKMGA